MCDPSTQIMKQHAEIGAKRTRGFTALGAPPPKRPGPDARDARPAARATVSPDARAGDGVCHFVTRDRKPNAGEGRLSCGTELI
jgi:hypothetical protein